MVSVTCPWNGCIYNGNENKCKLDEIELTRSYGDLKCNMFSMNNEILKQIIEMEERELRRSGEKIIKSLRELKNEC